MNSNPELTLIVIFHNMEREAPRTLFTISTEYQRGVCNDDYEVIVVDVGSRTPLNESFVNSFGENFRLVRAPGARSPVTAVNKAAAMAKGAAIALCIDGARMLSPGILRHMLDAFKIHRNPIVATIAYHLGPKIQNKSILEGYNQTTEDMLLNSVDWRSDGYELFRISSLAGSSKNGWFRPIAESNCVAIKKDEWMSLGGLHEGFISPGGGMVNLDFYREACLRLDPLLILLGEGTFHQFHGGVATNVSLEQHPKAAFNIEYSAIRGEAYNLLEKKATYIGDIPQQALRFLPFSVFKVLEFKLIYFCKWWVKLMLNFWSQFQVAEKQMLVHKQRGILVLGMHRSGTSAVAGALALAGASAPTKAMHATQDNPKGYWESKRISLFNNALLSSANSQWKDAGRIEEDWFDAPGRQSDAAHAAKLICSEFPNSSAVVCKDPRICRVLPVWKMAFDMLGGEWITVFVIRNPLAVAASLRRRMYNDQFRPASVQSLESGILLWLRYNIDAERHSRNMQRIIMAYEEVIADWKSEFAGVFSTGILPPPTPEQTLHIRAFLNSSLNREGKTDIDSNSQDLICGLKVAEAVRVAIFTQNIPLLEKIHNQLNHLMESSSISDRSILERLDQLEFL